MNSDPQVKSAPSDPCRALPAVSRLVRRIEAASPVLPSWAVLAGARAALDEARNELAVQSSGEARADALDEAALEARALGLAADLARPHPRRVVNATGIVLHTNLGRAPLALEAAAAAGAVAEGYSNLELDLETGERGDRAAAVTAKLRLLGDAAGALAVNNNAAALMLVLATLARGREVIVSRGELVEICGSFRVPEIMEAAGVRLVEVGTTNRTHPADYERAIGPDTALLLKVHRSNFELRGFVSEVELPELAAIGDAHELPVVEDLGSGTLLDLSSQGLPAEANAAERLRLGADVVCFSGDKLLGGPQAGLVLGADAGLVERMRRHPLARALRLDKLGLAALDRTLAIYLEGRAEAEIPVLRQLLQSQAQLEARARSLAGRLEGVAAGSRVEVRADRAYAGGGSLPGFELPTWVVRLEPPGGAGRCAQRLREAEPPVLARVRDGAIVLDVRTLEGDDEKAVESALRQALR